MSQQKFPALALSPRRKHEVHHHRGVRRGPARRHRVAEAALRRAGLVLWCAWVLGGCTSTTYWTKTSYTDDMRFTLEDREQFKRDHYVCAQESRVGWGASGGLMILGMQLDAANASQRLYNSCMGAHGWRQREKPIGAPVVEVER
jgi:hypothetical protein